MNFTKLTSNLINKFIDEMKKEENNTKLKTYVIDPCINHIMDKLYPYLIHKLVQAGHHMILDKRLYTEKYLFHLWVPMLFS